MNDLRVPILRRRLEVILGEWPYAADSKRDELIMEAMLIWRDLRAVDGVSIRTPWSNAVSGGPVAQLA